jgi:chloride channel 7
MMYFSIFNLMLALSSSLLTVYLEPASASDGIAEIKAYLNGVHVPRFFNSRTILVKIIGTIFSVSSGFACGPEGPMVHIGAGIASGLTRGDKLKRLCFELSPAILSRFHNDRYFLTCFN